MDIRASEELIFAWPSPDIEKGPRSIVMVIFVDCCSAVLASAALTSCCTSSWTGFAVPPVVCPHPDTSSASAVTAPANIVLRIDRPFVVSPPRERATTMILVDEAHKSVTNAFPIRESRQTK
ncbi:hypothetical protein [Prauserella cavernicola]|uniref:Uncharacterized protein n=1 Tax=Prauserella cavernicola TaxID=2800127 RepID=A0A934QU54_9PSEU|nr:hypothetical protein [Prauserella cavernicola]MBK1786651.1 hypothetical protein [Prauserella cavernicola]